MLLGIIAVPVLVVLVAITVIIDAVIPKLDPTGIDGWVIVITVGTTDPIDLEYIRVIAIAIAVVIAQAIAVAVDTIVESVWGAGVGLWVTVITISPQRFTVKTVAIDVGQIEAIAVLVDAVIGHFCRTGVHA